MAAILGRAYSRETCGQPNIRIIIYSVKHMFLMGLFLWVSARFALRPLDDFLPAAEN